MSGPRASRRRFIGATGIALSAPLAGLGATAVEAVTSSAAPPDDVSAIRALVHDHATNPTAPALAGVRAVVPDGFGAHDRIDVAADGRTATAVLPCVAATEIAIHPDHPLVDMARQQGGGVVARSERGVIEYACVKHAGAWTIARATFRPDS